MNDKQTDFLPENLAKLEQKNAPVQIQSTTSLAPEDLDYVTDCKALLGAHTSGWKGWILGVAVLFVGVFGIWAHWAEIDEVSRGTGKVIPSSSIQVIQT